MRQASGQDVSIGLRLSGTSGRERRVRFPPCPANVRRREVSVNSHGSHKGRGFIRRDHLLMAGTKPARTTLEIPEWRDPAVVDLHAEPWNRLVALEPFEKAGHDNAKLYNENLVSKISCN